MVSENKEGVKTTEHIHTIRPIKVTDKTNNQKNTIEVVEIDEVTKHKTQEVKLATITTDYTDKTYDLILNLDHNNQVSAIKTKSNKGKVKVYPVGVLGNQIVLVKAVGVSLVTLLCKNFDQENGCSIEIEYPSNLTYGKFLKFESQLVKTEHNWQLQSQDRRFSSMHLVAKKVFGILIGVDRIELR